MPRKNDIRILVVDDEPDVLELVVFHLEKQQYKVAVADTGDKALKMARENLPSMLILDLMLPGINGLEICRLLKRDPKTRNIPILMLTARAAEEDRVKGLELGAHDYVTKPFSPRELVARVNAVLRRVRPALAGETLKFADVEMDTVAHKVRRGGETVPLGPTEYRLFKHFLEHPGWVFSRERLLDSVWGHDSDIEPRTVDVHIRRLRKALNAGGRPDLIRTVRSAGYSLDQDAA